MKLLSRGIASVVVCGAFVASANGQDIKNPADFQPAALTYDYYSQDPPPAEPSLSDVQPPSDCNCYKGGKPGGGGVDDQGFADIADPAGAAASPLAGIPGTLGDLGGGSLSLGTAFGAFAPWTGSNIAIGGGDRRYKIAENTSPIPRDRVFFNGNHFHNAVYRGDGQLVDLDRYLFGIERTFMDGLASIEVRLPFAQGLDANQVAGAANESTEFGDIGIALKGIIYEDGWQMISVGVAMTLPSADDATFTDGADTLVVENEAFHIQPFIGFLASSQNAWFVQGFAQIDIDATGNQFANTNGTSGVIQDPALLYLSGSVGYWAYQSCSCDSVINGIAPMVELHYTTTLENVDTDPTGNVQFREGRFDVLNLSAGFHFDLCGPSQMRVFTSVPLRGENFVAGNTFTDDRFFDAEIGVQFNYGY